MIDLSKLSDLEVLILTIIGESRGEPIEGQIAVGSVIRNRSVKQNKNYSDICLAPKQFSCWNESDSNRVLLEELGEKFILGQKLEVLSHIQCLWVAVGIIQNKIIDNTHGSLNYLTLDLWHSSNKPSWAKNVNFAISKGSQIFFTAV
jgi:hypothetical protein